MVRPSLVTAARTGGGTAGVERRPWGTRRCVAAAAAKDVICLVSGVKDRAGEAWNTMQSSRRRKKHEGTSGSNSDARQGGRGRGTSRDAQGLCHCLSGSLGAVRHGGGEVRRAVGGGRVLEDVWTPRPVLPLLALPVLVCVPEDERSGDVVRLLAEPHGAVGWVLTAWRGRTGWC